MLFPTVARVLRRSVAIRTQSLASMETTPVSHITQSAAASTAFSEMATPKLPIVPSGVAQKICGDHSVSKTAPSGRIKLIAVASQIQCLVVALARRIEVKIHAATQTIEL